MSEGARIFLSYARADGTAFARTLRERLEAEGFALWQDLLALEGGRDWWTQIQEALTSKSLEHLVLALTPEALRSPVVRKELRLARQEGKQVSPVKGPGLDFSTVPRWIGHVYDLDFDEQWQRLLTTLGRPSTQRRMPFMAPERDSGFVQRPAEFGKLKAALIGPDGDAVAMTAALKGAGGFGKTVLAAALCHDDDIQEAYYDGILWVTLGEKPKSVAALVADLVERLTGERPGFDDAGAAASRLAEALGDGRRLLVIDDVWREPDLRPFLRGGPNTTRLITTRIDTVLPTRAVRVDVDAMRSSEARSLLAQGLPEAEVAVHARAFDALAKRLGEWALLLKLVNGFLRNRVKARDPLGRALAGVTARLEAKGLDVFSTFDSEERGRAVSRTLAVSFDLLSPAERQRFDELAVFEEDVDVPIGIAAALWREKAGLDLFEAEDLLARLFDISLLLSLDLGVRTFRLHDVVRHWLRRERTPADLAILHDALVPALATVLGDAGADQREIGYVHQFRPLHLAEAGRREELDALLLDPAFMRAKIETAGTQSLVADYRLHARTPAQSLIGRTLDLTGAILARDPRQVMPQLLARLSAQDAEGLEPLLIAASEGITGPALIPLRPTLSPPGAEIRRLEGHTGFVSAVAILGDGRIISGSHDNTLRLWDLATGEDLRTFEGHTERVRAVAAVAGGRAISCADDGTLRLWNVETGEEIRRFDGHTDWVRSLAVLGDGRVISGAGDRTMRLWDIGTGIELRCFRGHSGPVNAVAMLDARRVVSGSRDRTLAVWDIETGQELRTLAGHTGGVNTLGVLDGNRVVSGSADSTLRVWDIEAGETVRVLPGHAGSINALAVLDAHRVISDADDRTLRLWDVDTGTEVRRFDGNAMVVKAVAALDAKRIVWGSYNTLRLWDLETRETRRRAMGHADPVNVVVRAPGEGRVVSGSGDQTLRLWDIETGEELQRFEGHASWVRAAAFPDARRMVSASRDMTLRLWDLDSGKELRRYEGHTASVNAVAIVDDRRMISGSGDATLRLWDIETGAELRRFEGHNDWGNAVVVLDGGRVISGSQDRTLRLWDIETGKEIRRFEGHEGWVRTVARVDPGRVISGGDDNTLRLWDLETGEEIRRFEGHQGWVRAVIAGPGWAASGANDATLRLWDLETGEELARLDGDASFTAIGTGDGGSLLVGDRLGRIHLVRVSTGHRA